MKNKYFAFLALIAIVYSCAKPDDILNDFDVRVTPNFYSYTVQLNVEDITDPDAALPSDLDIEVTGRDAAGIYYTDGTKNFEVSNGALTMFIAKGFEPTENQPVEFDVRLTANGYRKNSKKITVEYEQYSAIARASLLNLNNLPSGVSNNTASGAVDPGTNSLSQPLTINAGTADSTSSADITIPAGSKFLDADGNVITAKGGASDLTVSVLSVSDTSKSGQDSYPGGTGLLQDVDLGGQTESFLLEPSSSFDISMELGGVEVSGLDGGKKSGAFTSKLYFSNGLLNPVTNNSYAVGDRVGVLVFNSENQRWTYEGETTVQSGNGKLYIEVSLTKTGPLKVYPSPSSISTSIVAFGGYIEPSATSETNMKQAEGSISVGNINLYYGPTFRTSFRLFGHTFRVSTNRVAQLNNNPSFRSGAGQWNGWDVTYDFVTPVPSGISADVAFAMKATQVSQGVTVGFTLECDGAFIQPPASTVMKYRLTNCGSTTGWQNLITFTSENVNNAVFNFPQLEEGLNYDFLAVLGNKTVDTCNVEMFDNGYIYEVEAPAALCSEIGF